ncbi:MAG: ATP-dependent RNA helicase HrpA [Deltaproteobacteria bacterium]|nr:ATP-dependent RNA helicase HrpA [Deltaproteobacteria bacterium]
MNIFYPENLPITSHKTNIIEAIKKHRVIIVSGDTGSGKTTQIGKMCLDALPDNKLLVGCTQPRRIAASTVAGRVSEELGSCGSLVGYKIRFHDHTSRSTRIKFMTDGVLLAETRSDPDLLKYGVLIIDEAHERSLNIDFLLGYLKRLLEKRGDLKVIVTSATIDTEAFSRHFNNAPVLSVAGRTYPVTVRYNPPDEEAEKEKQSGIDHCVQTVLDLLSREARGDILVFLPTERDIRECCTLLNQKTEHTVILPMFGRLQTGDQKKIFQNFKKVKVVVATNVAETSITVPGIRYVVDSGLARISYYNTRAKTTSLPVSKISRASCNQRKGRCGRIGPGVCIRLYSEEDYNSRDEYTLPELQRSNLAEVILQMISLKLGNPSHFPFIDPPHGNAIRDGYRLLQELGAITGDMKLTRNGRIMSDLPIDPCISRIILEAVANNCLREIKIIGAALALQDPRIRPAEQANEADNAHKQFSHPHSDFIILLNIWNAFHELQKETRSWSKLKKFCKTHFLSFQRMREWLDLHEQLDRILERRKGFNANKSEGSYEQIHKSLLAGFLRNIAVKRNKSVYQGGYNKSLMIFPGSHQFSRSGQWIIAADFIETSRLFALTVATIEPEWIETAAGNLCKYSWTNPAWHKKTGQVTASENVSLFGLLIITGRKVNFGRSHKKNIAEARDIFIQSALVHGEISGDYHFLNHNLTLVRDWEEAENKLRTRGIVADDLTFHKFYADRISNDVYDRKTFNRFLKRLHNKQLLKMSEEDVLLKKPEENKLADFPPLFNVGSLKLRLEYNFVPGSDEDGVTFRLPVDVACELSPHIFQWLVPGLLHEKLMFLLKGLPKNIRKNLVPVRNSVDRILDDIDLYSGSLYGAVESSILKQFRLLIRRSDWSRELPLHLQPRFSLLDSSGKEIASGRNLKKLIEIGPAETPLDMELLAKKDRQMINTWEKEEYTGWEFEGLPEAIPLFNSQGDSSGFLYPSFIPDSGRGIIKIRFDKNLEKVRELNRAGILYLYKLQFSDQHKSLKKFCRSSLTAPSALWLFESGTKNRKETVDSLLNYTMRSIFRPSSAIIEPQQLFEKNIAEIRVQGLYKTGTVIVDDLMNLLRKRREVRDLVSRIFSAQSGGNFLPKDRCNYFNERIDEILGPDFLIKKSHKETESARRQLHSLAIRVERYSINPGKDAGKEEKLSPHLNNLKSLEKMGDLPDDVLVPLEKYRQMLAEYRISVFSPEIRTSFPVSAKKLQQQWQAVMEKC